MYDCFYNVLEGCPIQGIQSQNGLFQIFILDYKLAIKKWKKSQRNC